MPSPAPLARLAHCLSHTRQGIADLQTAQCSASPTLHPRSAGHPPLSPNAAGFKRRPERRTGAFPPFPCFPRLPASSGCMGLIPGSLVTGQLAAGIALWLCRLGRTDFPIPEMQEFLPEGFRMALQSPGTRCYAANTAFRLSPMSLLRYATKARWLHGCIHSCTCLTGLRTREIEAEDRYAEIV